MWWRSWHIVDEKKSMWFFLHPLRVRRAVTVETKLWLFSLVFSREAREPSPRKFQARKTAENAVTKKKNERRSHYEKARVRNSSQSTSLRLLLSNAWNAEATTTLPTELCFFYLFYFPFRFYTARFFRNVTVAHEFYTSEKLKEEMTPGPLALESYIFLRLFIALVSTRREIEEKF